jgi:hypothetical protein
MGKTLHAGAQLHPQTPKQRSKPDRIPMNGNISYPDVGAGAMDAGDECTHLRPGSRHRGALTESLSDRRDGSTPQAPLSGTASALV